MKEVPKAIFSDGTMKVHLEGSDHFAGYNIDYLFREALKGFAQHQVDSDHGNPHDHRLLAAVGRNHLTPKLIDRYLEHRRIYDANIFLNSSGNFDAEFFYLNGSP